MRGGGRQRPVSGGRTIGEVADATGLSADTLRYYERIGLLAEVHREGGQRRFSDDDVAALGFVLLLRDTGMPVARMIEFMELTREGPHTIPDRLGVLEEHHRQLVDRLSTLDEHRMALESKMNRYRRDIGE